jgi:hypothetical protein
MGERVDTTRQLSQLRFERINCAGRGDVAIGEETSLERSGIAHGASGGAGG